MSTAEVSSCVRVCVSTIKPDCSVLWLHGSCMVGCVLWWT